MHGNAINTNFVHRDACYTKIKYTLTELTEKVKEKLICSGERDYALHFLEYLHSVGVPGATTEMIAVQIILLVD